MIHKAALLERVIRKHLEETVPLMNKVSAKPDVFRVFGESHEGASSSSTLHLPEDMDTIVANLKLNFVPQKNSIHVANIHVIPELRNRKFGRWMVYAAEKVANTLGCFYVYLDKVKDSDQARNFWKNCGYEPISCPINDPWLKYLPEHHHRD